MNAIGQVEIAFFVIKVVFPHILNKLTHQVMAALSLVEQINCVSGPIKDLLLVKVLAKLFAFLKLDLFLVLFIQLILDSDQVVKTMGEVLQNLDVILLFFEMLLELVEVRKISVGLHTHTRGCWFEHRVVCFNSLGALVYVIR